MTILKETELEFLSFLPAVLYEYVLYDDRSSEFLYMSPTSNDILGHPPEYFTEDTNRFWDMVNPDDVTRLYSDDVLANLENELFVSEIRILLPSGETRWIQMSSKPTSKKIKNSVVWSGYIVDITKRICAEDEKNELVKSLRNALNEIKTLKGIIPICSYCHHIRDGEGTWDRLEAYLSKHSDAEFSHGICPKCFPKAREKNGLD